eukprot:TRINITY_DN265_c0_g1_i2.p1 TRINITY_DN265_c0_g1~~TRINITY_DN265_c0_g1_i2.p1  ORF type:complete len:281 (-),score=136.33 TRINITY_DN265_c0_g1_i2:126-968(-)
MSTFTPTVFSSLGKTVADFFDKKFDLDRRLVLKSKAANGLSWTATSKAVTEDEKTVFTNELSAKLKHKVLGTVEVKGNTSGALSTEIKADKFQKGLVVKVSGATKPNGKVDVTYTKDFAAVNVVADVNKDTAVVEASAVVGFDGLSVGGVASFAKGSNELKDYNGAFEYTQSDFSATLKTENKANKLVLSLLHSINASTSFAARGAYNTADGDKSLEFGASHNVDETTSVKAKLNHKGLFTALFEQQVRPSVKLALVSQTCVPCFSSAKFGFALNLGDDE